MRLLQLHNCMSASLGREGSVQICHASCKQILAAKAATAECSIDQV
jgi:hypothetical protein